MWLIAVRNPRSNVRSSDDDVTSDRALIDVNGCGIVSLDMVVPRSSLKVEGLSNMLGIVFLSSLESLESIEHDGMD